MKHVESWWVEELPNGIYHLLINTDERWIDFSRISDTQFLIGEHDYGKNTFEDFKSKILNIPNFLPKNDNIYICTEQQNKDQISFYWIPIEKNYIKNRKIIFKSDERKNN